MVKGRHLLWALSATVSVAFIWFGIGPVLGDELLTHKIPEITYNTRQLTNEDVTATVQVGEEFKILNNSGSPRYTFSSNGSFVFKYESKGGHIGYVTAEVSNIDKIPPLAIFEQACGEEQIQKDAQFVIGGVDVQYYRYRVDDQEISAIYPVQQPIRLEDLSFGDHTLTIVGRDSAGNWQHEKGGMIHTWRVLTSDEYRPRLTTTEKGYKAIEVSIDEQHLWVYEGEKVIRHTAITSGARGMDTERGSFAISQMHMNKWFDGGFFSTYWMRFNKGMGLHDATWRDQFGTEDYVWRGSHGCVNLPKAEAEWLYNWAEIGTSVLVI